MVWFVSFLVAVVVGLLLSEFVHWRASVGCPQRIEGKQSCAVIVLGYPSTQDGRLHPIQRWRTEIGVRTLGAASGGSLFFTGAAADEGTLSEAEVMAGYAVNGLGALRASVEIETEAKNTWENLERCLPLAEPFEWIAIASDPLHAARARRYAALQRPDLKSRIVRSSDYRFLERWWLKLPISLYESAIRARDSQYQRHP